MLHIGDKAVALVGLVRTIMAYRPIALPTNTFPILALQDSWINELFVVQERRATDIKAPKL